MSHSFSYLESALEQWPAARREARLSTLLYPLTRASYPGLWATAALFCAGMIAAGLFLLGIPFLWAVGAAVVMVPGSWAVFAISRYDFFAHTEGPTAERVRQDLLSGAQLYFEETGESIWAGEDPADLPLRRLPAAITDTLRTRR